MSHVSARDGPAADGARVESDALPISQSNALVPLLILFAVTVLAIVWTIVRAKPFEVHAGAIANVAYSPADFPAIYGHDEATDGLSASGTAATALFPVPAPPFSPDIFPCSECHKDLVPSFERRALKDPHEEIVLRHDEEHRWCLDCHDAQDRDRLRLASGAPLDFKESYKLCGQCHGTQYRDWRSGIHGKRTGFWDGPKRYLLCVNCHNPHNPRFTPLKPLPPPMRPQFLGGGPGSDKSTQRTEEGHAGDSH